MRLAIVPDLLVPLAGIHYALAGYFPGHPAGGPDRAFLWRRYSRDWLAVCSALAPACAHARVEHAEGVVYRFSARLRVEKHYGKARTRVIIREPDAIRRWIANNLTGAELVFAQCAHPRIIKFNKTTSQTVTINVSDVEGLVRVTDADAFDQFLTRGGPGTGKVYGCGMWWTELHESAAGRLLEAKKIA